MNDTASQLEESDGEQPPLRAPTNREKFSVLWPALVALLGLIAMFVIFAVLASMSRS
jgi:hypothetical protein